MQGFSVLAVLLLVFGMSKWLGRSEDASRALTFTTLVIANLGLILTNRSWNRTILSMYKVPNRALWWVVGGAVIFLAMVLSIPFLRKLFHFAGLNLVDLAICLSAGVIGILWFELLKVFQKKGNI